MRSVSGARDMKRHSALAAYALLLALGVVLRFAPPGALRSDFLSAIGRDHPATGSSAQRLGYYEQLAAAARVGAGSGWADEPRNYRACVEGGKDGLGPILEPVADFRGYRHAPSASAVCFTTIPWQTNRFGFRGPEWSVAPAAGIVRVAVMGSSDVCGFGVAVEDTFAARLSRLLDPARFEVVNVAVSGYSPIDQVALVDDVLAISPQVILFVADRDVRATKAKLGKTAPSSALPETLRRFADGDGRAAPTTESAVDAAVESYRLVAEAARTKNVTLAWTALPDVDGGTDERAARALEQGARAAGFTIVDIAGVFAGYDLLDMWVHDYDAHLGRLAHDLVARKLAQRLTNEESRLLSPSPPTRAVP